MAAAPGAAPGAGGGCGSHAAGHAPPAPSPRRQDAGSGTPVASPDSSVGTAPALPPAADGSTPSTARPTYDQSAQITAAEAATRLQQLASDGSATLSTHDVSPGAACVALAASGQKLVTDLMSTLSTALAQDTLQADNESQAGGGARGVPVPRLNQHRTPGDDSSTHTSADASAGAGAGGGAGAGAGSVRMLGRATHVGVAPEQAFLINLHRSGARSGGGAASGSHVHLDVARQVEQRVMAAGRMVVLNLGQRAAAARRLRLQRIAALKAHKAMFSTRVAATVQSMGLRNVQYARSLRRQFATASRRVQELLFECFGEIQKARLRAQLFANQLLAAEQRHNEWQLQQLQWQRTLCRLEHVAAAGVEVVDVSPPLGCTSKQYALYEQAVEAVAETMEGRSRFAHLHEVVVHRIAVVRVPSEQYSPGTASGKPPRPRALPLAEDPVSWAELLEAVLDVCGHATLPDLQAPRTSRGGRAGAGAGAGASGGDGDGASGDGAALGLCASARVPLFPPLMLLSNESASWLGPAMLAASTPNTLAIALGKSRATYRRPAPTPLSSVVYYCLEERLHRVAEAAGSGSGDGCATVLTELLAGVYGVHPLPPTTAQLFAGGAGVPTSAHLQVVATESMHREAVVAAGSSLAAASSSAATLAKDALRSLPDVHVATLQQPDGASVRLHFVPAMAGVLTETQAFAALESRGEFTTPEMAALRRHYGIQGGGDGGGFHVASGMLTSLYVLVHASSPEDATATASGAQPAAAVQRPVLASLSGAAVACVLGMYVCRGLVDTGVAGMCNPDEGADGTVATTPRGVLTDAFSSRPRMDASPKRGSSSGAGAGAGSGSGSGGGPARDGLTVDVPATGTNPATSADPTQSVFQPVLTVSSSMVNKYCFVKGGGAGVVRELAIQDGIAARAQTGTIYSGSGYGAGFSSHATAFRNSMSSASTSDTYAALGLLVQCSVVTTAQHEERKRQRRMRRGKRQDRGAGLGGEDDDGGSSSASSASSDGGDRDRSRPLVRGLDAEDFKRYTDCATTPYRLGPYCQWRSCLASSMRAASKAYGADSCAAVAAEPVASLPDAAYRKSRSFCEPHAQLRHMLDAAAASTSLSSSGRASKGKGKSKAKPVSESSRYLPRDYGKAKAKAVSKTGAMPLSSIPSSSWLLHELMTGKLGATLKSFYKRVAANASAGGAHKNDKTAKPSAEAGSGSGSGTPKAGGPSGVTNSTIEAVLKSGNVKDINRTARVVNWEVDIAKQVRKMETAVTRELKRLAVLGTYPVDELFAIRREFELLDGERQAILQRFDAASQAVAASSKSKGKGLSSRAKAKQSEVEDQARRDEAKLELVFCQRKFSILRAKRKAVETARGMSPTGRQLDSGATTAPTSPQAPPSPVPSRPASRPSSSRPSSRSSSVSRHHHTASAVSAAASAPRSARGSTSSNPGNAPHRRAISESRRLAASLDKRN